MTDKDEFMNGMLEIVNNSGFSGEEKSAAMEAYILKAGLEAGVVREVKLK